MMTRFPMRPRCLWFCWTCVVWASACRQPAQPAEPQDRQADLDGRAAREAFDQGDLETSGALYVRTLERAYLRDDRDAIADASISLAGVMARLRRYDAALDALRLNASVLDSSPDRSQRLLLAAQILLEMGRLEEAEQALAGLSPQGPDDSVSGRTVETLRGLIAAGRGDAPAARDHLARVPGDPGPSAGASRARLTAAISTLEERWSDASYQFDEEANLHRASKNYAAMAEALARAGNAHARAGRSEVAADRFLRAGRSAALQKARLPAGEWLQRAADLGRTCGAASICSEADRWRGRIAGRDRASVP